MNQQDLKTILDNYEWLWYHVNELQKNKKDANGNLYMRDRKNWSLIGIDIQDGVVVGDWSYDLGNDIIGISTPIQELLDKINKEQGL